MAIHRFIRLVAVATLALVFFLAYLIFDVTPEHEVISEDKWRDPNLNLIDEPPEPLHRVNGDNYDPSNPNSDRINATLLSVVRNWELSEILISMKSLERAFNHKFNYPWTFFNDEPFTPAFKAAVSAATSATVHFHQIPAEHWSMPPWIDKPKYAEAMVRLKKQGVLYAEKPSYHQMCRWNSGPFALHPALQHTQYYWRVEPNVHYFCAIDYDVFRFMQSRNKTYGFTIALYDNPASIPSLWPETEKFLAAPENAKHIHPHNALGWLTDGSYRPPHHDAAHGYSTCHFWSNFEIGALDFWRSEAFRAFFDHLDRSGGFFYERWGDAPVHTIALGLLEDSRKIHWFRDIGYQHIPFFNCPTRPWGKCRGCKEGLLTDGEWYLKREDCRESFFDHVGFGEWER